MRACLIGLASAAFACAAGAEDQVWIDDGADNVWSTNAANWAEGSVWTNGNSAVFSGAGETVDISATVTVANVTFQTNGYVIADADGDGNFSIAGGPTVIAVPNSNDTAVISAPIRGSGGFTKTGGGQLQLTASNTYSGQTIVSNGTLRLIPNVVGVLGATGTDAATYVSNATIVVNGATLDLNGCYASSSSSEAFQIAGAGVDGKGALVNYGVNHNNKSVGSLTLLDHATVNSTKRIDANTVYGNDHKLTKIGVEQFCVRNLVNAEIIINEGTYTLLDDYRALGGTTPGDTTMNAGTLNAWNTMTVPERITFNGGTIQEGNPNNQLFTLTGHLTLNKMVSINSGSITTGVEVAGFVDGPGGFSMGQGWIYVTGDTNTYSGPTLVNGSRTVFVGKTNQCSGVLGTGVVTNWGTINAYSQRITDGAIVSSGAINVYKGQLCSGNVVNSGNIYFDRSDAFTLTNAFSGGGTIWERFGPSLTISDSLSTNSGFRLGAGTLTLTNGALFCFTGEIQLADRFAYSVDPTNVTGVINVPEGCTLMMQAVTFGNGTNVINGAMTGILNQAGTVITTGKAAEDNGIRLGHYPQCYSIYNMMAGTLIVGADYDLGCATDGNGWFNMTGGEVYTKRVMLNERDSTGGYGRLTVSGGTLNVGSLTGSDMAISNAICADLYAPYLVELGGAGGTIRAVTNLWIPASATLYGSGADAITFDSCEWTISMTNRLSGAGGLNKTGAGTLLLAGKNTFTGLTQVAEGTLLLGGAAALSNAVPLAVASGATADLGGFDVKIGSLSGEGAVSNGTLTVTGVVSPGTDGVGVLTLALASAAPGGTLVVNASSDGACNLLHATGDLALNGMSLQMSSGSQLDAHKEYTIIQCDGALSGRFNQKSLPTPWFALYDWAANEVRLSAKVGTMIRVR